MPFRVHALTLTACTLLGGTLLLAPSSSHALVITQAVINTTGGTLGGDPGFSGSLGYNFSLSSPFRISSLGFYDAGEDGLLSPHEVGVFDATSQGLLAKALIPAGNTASLIGGYRWVGLSSSITLQPGNYVLAATTSGDPALFDPFLFLADDVEEMAGFVIGDASLSGLGSGSTVVFPSTDEGVPYGFIGPNFASAPGPLPVLGAGAALGWSRRLRRRLGKAGRTPRA
ncbi:MAG: hypothetical protein VKK62_09285 [Synechococcaceae cyanobacterium]|nr:hypothetical protein [Synechococcaceae cyanobacterium]